eukprot:COSAG01_NODE_8585_length_2728_cov_14.207684_6_plen_112_part_00
MRRARHLLATAPQSCRNNVAGGVLEDVVLVAVDRSALPPDQEHERGYTVRLPDGSEQNTLASRLRLPAAGHSHRSALPLEPGRYRPPRFILRFRLLIIMIRTEDEISRNVW